MYLWYCSYTGTESRRRTKEIGDVKIYACSMTMELFDMKLEDLEPIVDDVTGVATFVERAREGRSSSAKATPCRSSCQLARASTRAERS